MSDSLTLEPQSHTTQLLLTSAVIHVTDALHDCCAEDPKASALLYTASNELMSLLAVHGQPEVQDSLRGTVSFDGICPLLESHATSSHTAWQGP